MSSYPTKHRFSIHELHMDQGVHPDAEAPEIHIHV